MTGSFITILWNVISFMSSGGRTYQPNLPHPGQLWVKYILLGDVWIVSGIVIIRNGVRSSVANTRKQCGWKGHKLSTSTMHRHSGLQLQQITMAADHSTAMAEDHIWEDYIYMRLSNTEQRIVEEDHVSGPQQSFITEDHSLDHSNESQQKLIAKKHSSWLQQSSMVQDHIRDHSKGPQQRTIIEYLSRVPE